jgi:hypothetical protein
MLLRNAGMQYANFDAVSMDGDGLGFVACMPNKFRASKTAPIKHFRFLGWYDQRK